MLLPQKTMFLHNDIVHINVLTGTEAMEQLRLLDEQKVRVCVYSHLEKQFLDTEGAVEFCRLWKSDLDYESLPQDVVPVLPCDYSACMVASALGITKIEVVLSHPLFETGIVQPIIFQHILQDIQIKVIAGGSFSEEDIATLLDWGCTAVLNYRRET